MIHLQSHRKAAGLTQQALAVKAGLSIQAVKALEAGARQPKLATAQALAEALGLTLAELLAPPKRNGRKRRSA